MRSIDPVHSLAFSIQANPGVYAVLVGSGVSRTAKIPTGWEIILDLIRKLAAVSRGGMRSRIRNAGIWRDSVKRRHTLISFDV